MYVYICTQVIYWLVFPFVHVHRSQVAPFHLHIHVPARDSGTVSLLQLHCGQSSNSYPTHKQVLYYCVYSMQLSTSDEYHSLFIHVLLHTLPPSPPPPSCLASGYTHAQIYLSLLWPLLLIPKATCTCMFILCPDLLWQLIILHSFCLVVESRMCYC